MWAYARVCSRARGVHVQHVCRCVRAYVSGCVRVGVIRGACGRVDRVCFRLPDCAAGAREHGRVVLLARDRAEQDANKTVALVGVPGGKVKQAVKWLQTMKDRGIEPDAMSYNSIINACAQGSQVEEAVKWLKTMQDQGIAPNIMSYNSVINASTVYDDKQGG